MAGMRAAVVLATGMSGTPALQPVSDGEAP